MNDKRCPSCDLLVDEDAARCRCEFVFWDDTPSQAITPKRLLLTGCLLALSLGVGGWLSYSPLAGQSYLTLGVLSLVVLALSLLPNLRKQGGIPLLLAMVALLWASHLSASTWKTMNPEKDDSPVVPLVTYKPSEKLNMEGLILGEASPESFPENLEIGVSGSGDKIVYVSGGRLFQGEHELLKPGDKLERIEARFETCTLEGPFLLLDKQIILVLDHDEEFIQNITLVSSPLKKGLTIDGVWLGMSRGLAQYLTRSPESKTQVFQSFYGVGGVLGTSLKTSQGQEFHQGQTLDPLPERSTDYYSGNPSYFVFLDERGAVEHFGMGTFPRGVLGTALVPTDLATQLELELLTQTCVEIDRNRRPTAFEEKWRMPGHKLTITGGTTWKRSSNLLNSELPHSLFDDELSASEWSIGERSVWRVDERSKLRNCTFLHQGQYFSIDTSTDYDVPLIDGDIVEKIGRAIVAEREGQ